MLTLSPGQYNDAHWGLLHEWGHNHQVRQAARCQPTAFPQACCGISRMLARPPLPVSSTSSSDQGPRDQQGQPHNSECVLIAHGHNNVEKGPLAPMGPPSSARAPGLTTMPPRRQRLHPCANMLHKLAEGHTHAIAPTPPSPCDQIGEMTIPGTGEVTCNLWAILGIERVTKASSRCQVASPVLRAGQGYL